MLPSSRLLGALRNRQPVGHEAGIAFLPPPIGRREYDPRVAVDPSMKAVGVTEFGGPEVLHLVDLPDPEAGPGELRIRVHAAAVNPTDTGLRSGGRAALLKDTAPPYVPGMDAAVAACFILSFCHDCCLIFKCTMPNRSPSAPRH